MRRRSLARQYMVFLGTLLVALSAGAFLITTEVTRAGLEDLFRHRLERTAEVFDQYRRGNHLTRVNEVETLLTSPRFLAALETGDPATVAREAPTHGLLAEASFVCVVDPEGNKVFASEGVGEEMHRRYGNELELGSGVQCLIAGNETDVYEIATAPIIANNGSLIGGLVLGRELSSFYAGDLKRLTGFDIVVGLDGREVGRTVSDVVPRGITGSSYLDIAADRVTHVRVAGEEFVAYRLHDEASGLSVAFVGSADRTIAPIMTNVRRLLLALAVTGSVIALVVLGAFTGRVGRRITELTGHADRIATGDLDFEIRPGPPDELGALAGAFERMRADLRAGRTELEAAHHAQIASQQMAAIGQMATGIVHDFKNPMAVVRGTADLILARDAGNAKLAKQCTIIHRQVDRMLGLARDLIEFAKGKTALEIETVELADWLRDVQENHVEPCRRHGIRMSREGPDGLRVMFDPDRMRRVLDNLLTNAREVSRPGDVVSLRWSRDDRDSVTLEVTDEGPGIATGLIDRIFEPFVTSGKDHGSGLGLAISKKIVEDHGATVDVANVQGKGARFRIRFPSKLYVSGGQKPAQEGVAP